MSGEAGPSDGRARANDRNDRASPEERGPGVSATDATDDGRLDTAAKRIGARAGGVAFVVLLVVLVVGPWRVFDLSVSGGVIPIDATVRESGNAAFYLAALATVVVGAGAGGYYQFAVEEHGSDATVEMATWLLLVPLFGSLALLVVGTLFAGVAGAVSSGSPTAGAFLGVLVGVLVVALVWPLLALLLTFYVGLPGAVGIAVGRYGAVAAERFG